jgi:hypothetical protein
VLDGGVEIRQALGQKAADARVPHWLPKTA